MFRVKIHCLGCNKLPIQINCKIKHSIGLETLPLLSSTSLLGRSVKKDRTFLNSCFQQTDLSSSSSHYHHHCSISCKLPIPINCQMRPPGNQPITPRFTLSRLIRLCPSDCDQHKHIIINNIIVIFIMLSPVQP